MNITEAKTDNDAGAFSSPAIFKAMLDHSGSATLLTCTDGAIRYANKATCELWGYTPDELCRKNYRDLLDLSDILDLKALAYTGKEKQASATLQAIRKDRKRFTCTCTTAYFDDGTGTFFCVITVTDTTALHDREHQLEESNERYKYAAQASLDAIWDWDIHSDVLFWSENYHALFGYMQDSNKTSIASWHNRIHREDRAHVMEHMHNALRKGMTHWMQEYRYLRADGTYAHVTDRGIIINDGTGIPCRMIGVMQDVSTLREAERGLLREQTLLQTLIDNIPDYVYVKNASLEHILNNKPVRKILGNHARPVATLAGMLAPEAAAVHKQDDLTVLETGEPVINRQEAIIMADGKTHWLLTSKIPLQDEHGHITGLIGISRDITERVKKTNERELFLRIVNTINTYENLSDALQEITQMLVNYTGAAIVEAWTTSVDKRELLIKAQTHADTDKTGIFSVAYTGKTGEGEDLPGMAWEHKQPEWRGQLSDSRNFSRKEAAKKAELNTAVAIPVICNDDVVAVFTCYSHATSLQDLKEHTSLFLLLQEQLGSPLLNKRTEDELNRFFNLTPDLLCIAGTDGYFKKINAAFTTLLGYSEAEILSNPYYFFIHPDDLNKTADTVQSLANGRAIHYFENRYRTKAGGYRWFAWTSTPVPEEHIMFGVGKDITEKKRLLDIEALEKEILELNASPDSTLEVTVSYYVRKIEALHEGMIGSVLRLENGRLYNLASPGLPEAYCNAIEGIMTGDKKGSCGTAAFRKQKVIVSDIAHDPLWEDYKELALPFGLRACWSFPIIGSNQKVLGTFAFYYKEEKLPTIAEEHTIERARNLLHIIMENKMAEKALQLSNERYNLVARATNDAIWDWNIFTDEVVRTGNGFLKLFGYNPEEVQYTYHFWTDRIHPGDLQKVLDKQKEILTSYTGHYWEDEYRFLRADGTYAYVTDRGYILRDAHGNATRMIGATQDITQRKQTELLLKDLNERLEKRARDLSVSNAELERFAYVSSHDLQEPLRMISGFMQLLQKKYAAQLDDKALEYIGYATDGAERMKQLILDLLEYSRVNTDAGACTDVDMNEIMHDVLNIYAATIQETNAAIHIPAMPVIRGRRSQVLQLFQNLVGNALKYRNDHAPVIDTGYYETDDKWVFFVQDNGIGIDPKFFEKIFIIFQRLHNRNEYSGTGIGLAICKKIAERHGGEIWLESQPGSGSCFYVSIAREYPRQA